MARSTVHFGWFLGGIVVVVLLLVGVVLTALQPDRHRIPRLGATTIITEASTGLPLEARVDTGAAVCSLHCDVVEIEDESPDPAANIGRPIRCLMKNNRGETAWLETQIIDYYGVRTTTKLDDRYFALVRIRTNGIEDTVRASLNDRTKMKYPFLLGRNYLREKFVVDVRRDRDRMPTELD